MVKNKDPQKRNGEGKCNRIWKKECIIMKGPGKCKAFKNIFIFLMVGISGSSDASFSSCFAFD